MKKLLLAVVVVLAYGVSLIPVYADGPPYGSSSSGGNYGTYGIDSFTPPYQTVRAMFKSDANGGTPTPDPGLPPVEEGPIDVPGPHDISGFVPTIGFSQPSPIVYGGGVIMNYHATNDATINISVSGAPMKLTCNASGNPVQWTNNNTDHVTVVAPGGSRIINCVVYAYQVLTSSMTTALVTATIASTGTADKPTSGQSAIALVLPDAQVDWKDFPHDPTFTLTTTEVPYERPETAPFLAFENSAVPACGNSPKLFGCFKINPPSQEPKLHAVIAAAEWVTNNNTTVLRCTLGKVNIQSTDPQGVAHQQVIDTLYYTGDLQVSATINYVTYKKNSATYPNQFASLDNFSLAVKNHEKNGHAKFADEYYKSLKPILISQLAPETAAALGVQNGIFELPAPPNYQNVDPFGRCITAVTNKANSVSAKLIGTANDAYTKNAAGITVLRPEGAAQTPMGKMVSKDRYWDKVEADLCFYGNEGTPAANDPVVTDGCKVGNFAYWSRLGIKGTFTISDPRLVYTVRP
ncbi:MAG: hypothetical protein KBD00_06120 [Candidatus Peribacteraceae bacterium]|nr:hypothetical protein [Candidatus Peribacteraceae bacterium]